MAKDKALKQLQLRQRWKLTFVKGERDKRNVGDKEESETKLKSLLLSDYKGEGCCSREEDSCHFQPAARDPLQGEAVFPHPSRNGAQL